MAESNSTNITYSYTRAKMLSECERKYYLTNFEAAGGWRNEASQASKTAYKLKKLQPIPSVLGTTIHSKIAQVLANRDINTPDEFTRAVFRDTRAIVNESRESLHAFNNSPGKINMVQEIYYNNPIDHLRNPIADKARLCATNFYHSKSYREMSVPSASIISLDELEKVTQVEYTAYIKLDAFFRNEDGTFVIVDWKTGRAYRDDHVQILLYTYFIVQNAGISVETWRPGWNTCSKVGATHTTLPMRICVRPNRS
jgi:hypothetical protein